MSEEYKHHGVEITDKIAVVTCDRPPVNAQNRGSREELIEIFDMLSDRDDVNVVVLTGAGKTFSAGADIKERVGMEAQHGDYVRHNRLTREFFYAVSDCEKPVIAAVNGPAIGAGFALMLACDIMLASETAYFVMPEVDVGLAGGSAFLMEHFSKSRARAMYFTGRRYPASELYRLGIIEAVLPPEQLLEEAMAYAREIAAKSPVALRTAKRAFGTVGEMPVRDAYRYEQSLTVALSHTEDAKEAQRAFVEKRKPVFKGK
ncbi:enoyl-CoA hydratase/isomerase family protein [Roseibium limicola]|uniref:Enoyl-CoA hydratase/isomerase family protein n=1 Tax=Roseibium limicola TaxID=2816037 RepID=A0A939ELW9_9HYPH|nr:enoyl-CoA hydratase/isomerase family protein [Roseibium limicola]